MLPKAKQWGVSLSRWYPLMCALLHIWGHLISHRLRCQQNINNVFWCEWQIETEEKILHSSCWICIDHRRCQHLFYWVSENTSSPNRYERWFCQTNTRKKKKRVWTELVKLHLNIILKTKPFEIQLRLNKLQRVLHF